LTSPHLISRGRGDHQHVGTERTEDHFGKADEEMGGGKGERCREGGFGSSSVEGRSCCRRLEMDFGDEENERNQLG